MQLPQNLANNLSRPQVDFLDFEIEQKHDFFCPVSLKSEIDQYWASIQQRNAALKRHVWDGIFYRLDNIEDLLQGRPFLKLGRIQYSTVLGLAKIHRERTLPIEQYPFHICTGALVLTSDDQYLFGVKTELPSESDLLDIVGGGLQSSEIEVTNSNDLFRNVLKELKEECNIDEHWVKQMKSLGILFCESTLGLIFTFHITLKLTSKEAMEFFNRREDFEFSHLKFVEARQVSKFLASQKRFIRQIADLLPKEELKGCR